MKEDQSPAFVHRDGMIADKEYVAWLSEIKQRFQHSQIKAAVRVNSTMLEFGSVGTGTCLIPSSFNIATRRLSDEP